jgi:endonuclease III
MATTGITTDTTTIDTTTPGGDPATTTTGGDPATLARELATRSRTFAAEAGIDVRDAPAPLFRLLVLACLLASPIHHTTAVRASLALRPLTRTAATLAKAQPTDVARLLTAAGYWRFYETKARLLVRSAEAVVDRFGGDLRRLYREADSTQALHRELRRTPGVGTQAAHIVLREAQWVWPDLMPYLDDRVLDGARRLGLPADATELAALVEPIELPRLAAGCVRATLTGATTRPTSPT